MSLQDLPGYGFRLEELRVLPVDEDTAVAGETDDPQVERHRPSERRRLERRPADWDGIGLRWGGDAGEAT